jgi:hypothetical protein
LREEQTAEEAAVLAAEAFFEPAAAESALAREDGEPAESPDSADKN